MKLVATRKANRTPHDADIAHLLNTGFGTSFKVVPDNEVTRYIEEQAMRGFVCYEFDHACTYHAHTTVVKASAA